MAEQIGNTRSKTHINLKSSQNLFPVVDHKLGKFHKSIPGKTYPKSFKSILYFRVNTRSVSSDLTPKLYTPFWGQSDESRQLLLAPVVQRTDNFIKWISHYPTVSICAKISVFPLVPANMHTLTTARFGSVRKPRTTFNMKYILDPG